MQLCSSLSILWHCLSLGLEWKLTFSSPVATTEFPNLLAYWVHTFTASFFRIWNSSTGILSPPLALFVVMLSKAHLTSHSRMSGSRSVIAPSWLSGYWRSFLYSSSVYSCHLFLVSSASVRHYWLDGRESQWTPGVGDGLGGLACCDSWGRKESDTTEQLNWTDYIIKFRYNCSD